MCSEKHLKQFPSGWFHMKQHIYKARSSQAHDKVKLVALSHIQVKEISHGHQMLPLKDFKS